MTAAPAWVLLVEDSDDDLLLTRRGLAKVAPELATRVARDGAAAIELLSHHRGDAASLPLFILLDWKLPLRSGAEVLAWIRSALPHSLAVVVLTSSPLPEDRDTAHRLGADGLLQKPLRGAELQALLGPDIAAG